MTTRALSILVLIFAASWAGPANDIRTATWCAPTPRYCHGWDRQYVAAVGSFRYGDEPYTVQVCRADRPSTCTHVLVVSFCECRPGGIDLSVPAFKELAPLSVGVIEVRVSAIVPPRTDAR